MQELAATFENAAPSTGRDEGASVCNLRKTGIDPNFWYPVARSKQVKNGKPMLDLWNVYVPLDKAQRSNHTYGLMMIRRPAFPGLLELFWPFVVWFSNLVFAEDRQICELEQAAFDQQGADWNHEVFPLIRGLRKVLVENSSPLADED